ncbi:hypothetical protein Tco_1059143 [Tanacetum coccineum]
MLRQRDQAVNLSTHTPEPSRHFNSIFYDDDDDEESIIPLNEIIFNFRSTIAITRSYRLWSPRTLSSWGVEDLVPIPKESEDTSDSDKECDLPFCDNSVTFSNPLFDANDDFTSSDDESLPEEDV